MVGQFTTYHISVLVDIGGCQCDSGGIGLKMLSAESIFIKKCCFQRAFLLFGS